MQLRVLSWRRGRACRDSYIARAYNWAQQEGNLRILNCNVNGSMSDQCMLSVRCHISTQEAPNSTWIAQSSYCKMSCNSETATILKVLPSCCITMCLQEFCGQRCWIYSVERLWVCYPSCALLYTATIIREINYRACADEITSWTLPLKGLLESTTSVSLELH